MRDVADLVDDLRPSEGAGDEVGGCEAHDATVALRMFLAVDERTAPGDGAACAVRRIANVEGVREARPEAILVPAHEVVRDVGSVIFAETRETFSNAEGHRRIVRPVAGRRAEDVARHHLHDPRMSVLGRELNRRTETVSYYEAPEEAEGFVGGWHGVTHSVKNRFISREKALCPAS